MSNKYPKLTSCPKLTPDSPPAPNILCFSSMTTVSLPVTQVRNTGFILATSVSLTSIPICLQIYFQMDPNANARPLCPAGHRREGEGRVGPSCIYFVFIHFYLAPRMGMRVRVLGKLIPCLHSSHPV